ncbi:MAG: ribonuclease III [Mycoplasmataceae bacterium]|jgi:ribonuclease-3|nr:ribonuclease III [Mycoplasmataceae bacterium]
MDNNLQKIFEKFNIKPKNIAIYYEAFTHSTYAYDHKLHYDYNRLEFLGDAVISLVTSEFLYNKHSHLNEGSMSKNRIIMVQSKTEVKASKELNLNKIVKLGGAIKSTTKIADSILEDVFEAFIGAVYLDQGINKVNEILSKTIIRYFSMHSLNDNRDFKSLLQEYMQKYSKHDIHYKLIQNINGNFIVNVIINNIKYGTGKGNKIKDAEMQAAKNAYCKFAKGEE